LLPLLGGEIIESDLTTTTAQEVKVEIENFLFQPSDISIPVGTTVIWTNRDGVPHTATSNDGVWDSGNLSEGESFSFTFEEPGTYPYLCLIHPLMRGTVTVTG
jgi:plastocyanin